MRRHLQPERGSTMSMAMIALTIIAMIMLFVGTQTMSSIFIGKRKQATSLGMAAADSAVEMYRLSVQSSLADEYDGYQLSRADLERLLRSRPTGGGAATGATVISSSDNWERQRGLKPAQVPPDARFTVAERKSDGTYSFWQVYQVVTPSRLPSDSVVGPAELTIFFRAWTADSPQSTNVSDPRLFRAEFRPSYFSDYQIVSNGPFVVDDNDDYDVNGPIHSNGYVVQGVGRGDGNALTGILFGTAPTCGSGAEFTTSRNAPIQVPGDSCQSAPRNRSARELSLLGVEQSYRWIEAECASAAVLCLDTERPSLSRPYRILLATNGVVVNGTHVPLVRTARNSASLTVLASDEVVLGGTLSVTDPNLAGRVTIANRRRSGNERIPRIMLQATSSGAGIGSAQPGKDVVGLITQGDVVLGIPPARSCIGSLSLAAISGSGSITIPPEYSTFSPPPINLESGNYQCTGRLDVFGSYSMHASFVASMAWRTASGGRTRSVGYPNVRLRYGDVFYRNTPPFFPQSLPWGVVKAKEANQSCLIAGTARMEPTCE